MAKVHAVAGRRVVALEEGWELAATAPGRAAAPADLDPGLDWIPARAPGTAAQALRDAGLWTLDAPEALHDRDFWWRLRFSGDGGRTLRLHGLATLAEVWLDGKLLLRSTSMFTAHEIEIALAGDAELHLAFRALAPALAAKTGRARWRTALATPGALRHVRATLLGHMPGWCPPVHAVGPWRPIELVEESGPLRVLGADLRSGLDGTAGTLALRLDAEWTGPGEPEGHVEVAGVRAALRRTGVREFSAELRIEGVEPWLPHTHGRPALHAVRAELGGVAVDLGRTGFRRIDALRGEDGAGFAIAVNGRRVFCRGACWTSADIVSLPCARDAYAPWLERMRDAGMNMVRIPGVAVYEGDAFFELCDELGLLVWQDFMFANFDYPASDPAFAAEVAREAGQFLDRTQSNPALAVLCGGSEAVQQAAMLGLPRAAWPGPLFDRILPEAAARLRPELPYVPNTPFGGDLPFQADRGVAHYYGVGAYLRPLDDARRAGVRFAAECLAFSQLPEDRTLARLPEGGTTAARGARLKARVPRDPGAAWDFEDVREHYLGLLYGVDPARLGREDPTRHLRLSRAVVGEIAEEVFAEWRRARSTCAGALVWTFQDLWPAAGWGVVDSTGAPKAAWHALRRAFRPVQVALTDEGLNGLALHLHNETPHAVEANLEFVCLRDGAVPVVSARHAVTLDPGESRETAVAALLPAFFDTTYAYRFGAPQHDVSVATLRDPSGAVIAEAFHFPRGRGGEPVELGLAADLERDSEGWRLRLASRRLAQSVHVEDAAYRADDEWFHLAPGVERIVRLIPANADARAPDGEVHAVNGLAPSRYRRAA